MTVGPRTIITFPPAADPSLPYGALPLLGAILRRAGYSDTILRDVNLEAFDDLLDRAVLERSLAPAKDIPPRVSEAVANIGEAKRILRDPVDFYQPEKLLFAKYVFNSAADLLTAGRPNVRLGKYSYSLSSYDSFEDVASAVTQDAGPFGTYFRDVTVPSLLAARPDIVGFSVAYFSQLVPAFLLADAIRAAAPGVHLTWGGPVMTWGSEVLLADPRFGRWLDSLSLGEADDTLLRLVEAIDGKRDVHSITNLALFSGGTVSPPHDDGARVSLDWLPVPAFTMMPMSRYFAPKQIICLAPTRGCYYNRCSFCNYAFIKLTPYRMRSPKLIAEDVATIVRETGQDVFCFETDVILPRDLSLIAQALIDRGTDVKWHGVARFEKGFTPDVVATMRRSGCVRLYMGLESANDRVLAAMQKGTDAARIAEVLSLCHGAGIGVEAGIFTGFPSETAEEAEDTFRFIRDHAHQISRADVGSFRLLKGAPIASEPEKFGIKVLGDPKKYWYHLEYTRPDDASNETAVAVGRIQRLYPEVALVDVPEDILYTARDGPEVFRRFFAGNHEEVVNDVADTLCDGAQLTVSPSCEIIDAVVTNSGAVHFRAQVSPDDHAQFEISNLQVAMLIDRSRNIVMPLQESEEQVVRAVQSGRRTAEEIIGDISTGGLIDKAGVCRAVRRLIHAGFLRSNAP